MKKQLHSGCLLLLPILVASLTSAQSPRPDVSWLAGGHVPPVLSVAYSPDGTMLASGGGVGDTIKLWRTSDGSMLRTLSLANDNLQMSGAMTLVKFLHDGRTIIGIGDGVIGYWNVADGRLLRAIFGAGDLAIDRDETLIAVASFSSIKLLRISDGLVIRSIAWPSGFVQQIAFSPDGTTVAGGDSQGKVRSFRVNDGAPLLTIPAHTGLITSLCYSPDGRRIASASSDKAVRLWDGTTGKPAGTLAGHTNQVTALEFSADGLWLGSGSFDGTVKFWKMPAGDLSATLSLGQFVYGLSFNPTSSRVAVAAYNDLQEWDVSTQTLVRNFVRSSKQISGTVFNSDGTELINASNDGKVSISNVVTGALLRQLEPAPPGVSVTAIATRADLVAAASSYQPSAIKLYRLSDGAFLRTLDPGNTAYIFSVTFSPDGMTLATGHGDAIRLWNTADGSLLRTLPGNFGERGALAYTSDGSRLISVSFDGLMRVWDAQGNLLRSMGQAGQIRTSVAISPDNQFALSGVDSGLLQLWRIDDGALVYSLASGGRGPEVRFTPNGYAFYAAASDGKLRIYRASDHALLETYRTESGGGGQVTAIAVSPDGEYLSYGRTDSTIVTAYNTLIAAPVSATFSAGQLLQGSFQDLVTPDGIALVGRSTVAGSFGSAPLQLDVAAHAPLPSPTSLCFQIIASTDGGGLRQEVWMRNAKTGMLELVDSRRIGKADQPIRIDLGPNFPRFMDGSGNFMARVKWFVLPPDDSRIWKLSVDQAIWAAGL